MAIQHKKLKLGIIGMSDGNGHPYSWAAIINGYNMQYMRDCPFPSIPEYLSKEKFPENFLTQLAEVSHVWTQDKDLSGHIAKSSNITTVVSNAEDMIGQVDAILLARDDAHTHASMASPFLKAGIPVFIDKPFALTMKDAEQMLQLQQEDWHIFTCSSLRYAEEVLLTKEEKNRCGTIYLVEASVPKYWETYAIHLLEPILMNTPNRGELLEVKSSVREEIQLSIVKWQNTSAYIKTTGKYPSPLLFTYYGENATVQKSFVNSFACFKASIQAFIEQVNNQMNVIDRKQTLELVQILEWGKN